MWLLAHLSRWLGDEGLDVSELHASQVERFLRARHAAGYTYPRSIKAMQPILAFLRGLGVVPLPPLPTPSALRHAALLFSRFDLIRRWMEVGQLDLESAAKPEREKMAEQLNACLGQALAQTVLRAAGLVRS